MKRISIAMLSTLGVSVAGRESRAPAPAQPAPAGMSWEPADVWKNVKPTTPADFWPQPSAETPGENPRQKGGAKKGAAKKKQP